jgi:hypothetical protein
MTIHIAVMLITSHTNFQEVFPASISGGISYLHLQFRYKRNKKGHKNEFSIKIEKI